MTPHYTGSKTCLSESGRIVYNLKQGLVTYIGYRPKKERHEFSYETCADTLANLGLPCKPTTLRKEFSILKNKGLIEFRTYYRKPYPVLSQSGRLLIKTKLSFRHFGPWDEKWRFVIFDIPERERKFRYLLRQKLCDLGFAALQDSVYLSPHPLLGTINRAASDWGIRQFVKLMEISKLENEQKIVDQAWDVETIDKDYKNFIADAKKAPKDNYWVFRAKDLERQFAEIYQRDPHLPEKFLPEKWHGGEAYKMFQKISNSY